MSNLILCLLLLSFAVLGLPVIVFSVFNREESDVSGWFILLCVSNMLWAILHALSYVWPDENIAKFFRDIRLVFVCTSSILIYLVVFGTLKRKKVDARILVCFFMVPLITFFITIVNRVSGTGLLNKKFEFIIIDGIRTVDIVNGPWFWVHCIFCYALLAVAAVMVVRHFTRMPQNYRAPAAAMLLSIIFSGLMSVLAIVEFFPYDIDGAPFVAIVSQILFYFAMFHPQSVDLLVSSRDLVFEMTAYPMLVLNNNREIVDCNGYAEEIGRAMGIDRLKGTDYDKYLCKWIKQSAAEISEVDPSIFTIHEKEGDEHFQVISSQLYNRRKKEIGLYIEIKNITPTMVLVHQLQASAYFDHLTGLRNRNYFIHVAAEYDQESNFPLGVLMSDLNNLKLINDTLGHVRGDFFLQKIAEIFNECKPPETIVFRIGGDEFLALTPHADDEVMQNFVDNVKMHCAQVEEIEGKGLSIALAYQIKSDHSQSLQEVIHQADMAMYVDKNDRRRS